VPGDGGCFEVARDGQLLFSKLKLKRFPEEGEVAKLIASPRGG
jgi:selT/selW/selH-like putative selenoprotein